MKVGSLFSGIGGFDLGLQRAGHEIIWHSEIDKYACKIYHKHFPKSRCLGDVKKIEITDRTQTEYTIESGNGTFRLPKADIITFGFPCQDLSVAGQRKGIHAEQSGLFFEAMRIIGIAKPKIFIFENVKGLLFSNGGRDFATVLKTIANIGLYECEWQLLNTRWFLPQNRERIYFVGHLRGESRPKVFPINKGDRGNIATQGETFKEGTRVRSSYPSVRVGGGNQKGLISLTLTQRDYKSPLQLIQVGNLDDKDNQTNRIYSPEGISPTIPCPSEGHHMPKILTENIKIRRLTPVECERLQGFPDGWTEGVSDTQRYKQLGNAVSVPCSEAIGRKINK